MNRLRWWAPKLLLVMVSLGVTLALGEIVFRLPAVVRLTGGNTPGMTAFRYEDLDEKPLRTLHWERPKKPGVFRIVTLGDSYTWAAFIPNIRDAWPYVLERKLGKNVEVVNLGVQGFTTVNEAEMLEKVGWSFAPDLIILNFTVNDPLPVSTLEDAYFKLRPLSPVFHDWLDKNSYLYSYLNSMARRIQMAASYPDSYLPLFSDEYPGWRACAAALTEMASQARQRKVPALVVIFPLFAGRLDHSYQLAPAHAKVAETCRKAGWEVLDLREAYAKIDPLGKNWWALPCDGHPNARAHQVAGEAIAERLKSM